MLSTRSVAVILSASVLVAATTAASVAQTSPGATTPPMAGNSAQSNPSESLSTKLSKSNGVITPNTAVDPGMKVPAPDPHPNSTPVIPPSSGGGIAK